jgi:nitrile hydratase
MKIDSDPISPQFKTDFPAVAPRFRPGDAVRVRKAAPPGHIRTPFYIRGHAGVIERLCGAFPNPEELAQMRDGLPAQPLYRVRFRQKEVWPDYGGGVQDELEVEIFQHWLEKA